MDCRAEIAASIENCNSHSARFRENFSAQSVFMEEALKFALTFPNILLGDEEEWDADDREISIILNDGILDIFDSITNIHTGRLKLGMVSLRCFLEHMFFSLYYREQSIEFTLWRRFPHEFVMLHQLYSDKHSFRKYFLALFIDRKDGEWKSSGKFSKIIFDTLDKLYSSLSWSVHGRLGQREETPGTLKESEVNLYCHRLRIALSICYEFLNIAGKSPKDNVLPIFKFTEETILK